MQINEETGTCEVLLLLPILAPKVLMMRIVERVAAATMVRQTAGLTCFIPDAQNLGPSCMTELLEAFA